MSKDRDYSSTVMRMAGNIAAGFASAPTSKVFPQTASADRDAYVRSIAEAAVLVARAIVAEVQRTAHAGSETQP